jgi:hypothetical protein
MKLNNSIIHNQNKKYIKLPFNSSISIYMYYKLRNMTSFVIRSLYHFHNNIIQKQTHVYKIKFLCAHLQTPPLIHEENIL